MGSSESARIIAHIGIQPHLSRQDLRTGLTPAGIRALDQQLSARSVTQDLARIKIWNARDKVIYSDDHSVIGRTLPPSDDLLHALAGTPNNADVVTPRPHTETASEVGLGQRLRLTAILFTTILAHGGAAVSAGLALATASD